MEPSCGPFVPHIRVCLVRGRKVERAGEVKQSDDSQKVLGHWVACERSPNRAEHGERAGDLNGGRGVQGALRFLSRQIVRWR